MSKQYKNQKAKWIEYGKVQEQERVLKLINDFSVPVMDADAMDKFVEENEKSSVYRIVNFDNLKQATKGKVKG